MSTLARTWSPRTPHCQVPLLRLGLGRREGDQVVPRGPELLHVDLGVGGENERHMTEEAARLAETDDHLAGEIRLELIPHLREERVRRTKSRVGRPWPLQSKSPLD